MEKSKLVIISIIAVSFLLAVFLYPLAPARMASHWNIQGQVDGYMPKFWGLFIMPIISLIIFLFFLLLPKIDPLKENYSQFKKYFNGFILLIFLFLFYIYSLTIFWNFGYRFDMFQAMMPALAILFYFAGILVEKSKRNWFVGIKTPWTLSSDFIWNKTHRLGGKMFKVAAIISLAGFIFPRFAFWLFFMPIVLAGIVPVVYSYLLFKKTK